MLFSPPHPSLCFRLHPSFLAWKWKLSQPSSFLATAWWLLLLLLFHHASFICYQISNYIALYFVYMSDVTFDCILLMGMDFFKILLNFLFKSTFRFPEKSSRRYRGFSCTLPHTGTDFPTINITHHSGTFVTNSEPTLTHHYHPMSI